MEKFLIFIDAADDAAMYPASKLVCMTCAGDGAVLLRFPSGVAGGTGAGAAEGDLVTLTCTADTEKAVFTAVAQAINGNRNLSDGAIVVCDDVNSVFLHKNILSCTITLDS
jgi:hypothetical protein|tara:strand:+ start:557 stop:889 length:333 start_codon:yes stop_codon:yes gene_type:complete